MSSTPAPRVLVVDDDESVRLFAQRALLSGGYDVVAAGDGAEALQLATQPARRLDLCVVDFKMPRMTGDELAAALRRADPDVKELYPTGFGDALFTAKGSMGALIEAVSLLLYRDTHGPSRSR
jgi:two-component system cell cycle sensor histidine kinase/response regulator CckA